MKKRTAIISALVSLLPMGQPLLIGTGAALTSAAVMLFVPEKAKAESARFYIKRGDEKLSNEDYYGAISEFNKAIDINSNDSYAYRRRGRSKFWIQDYQGSLSDYNKSIEIDPSNKFTYQFRGDTKLDSGDSYGAISDFLKAIDIDPKDPYSYDFMGDAKQKLGDIKGACSDWREASSLKIDAATQKLKIHC